MNHTYQYVIARSGACSAMTWQSLVGRLHVIASGYALATLAPHASAGVTSRNKFVCICLIQIHLFRDQTHIEQNILHVLPGLGVGIT
jgi:hypothetical protein